jgi:regulator of PEP synthase PpsR (kinase-PPPase family)
MKNSQTMQTHKVFFVSDQTGVTVETLGHSLLEQFDGLSFETVTLPFVDSVDKAREIAARINLVAEQETRRPIVFASLVKDDVRAILLNSNGLVLDFFEAYLGALEAELKSQSSHRLRRDHGIDDSSGYNQRIEATNFALAADDGSSTELYKDADLILMGVSRSGKTPTCLYLALQYGIFAANYPLTSDDFERTELPRALAAHRSKLYGLTIKAEHLQSIRWKRRPEGQYASPRQVSFELRSAESMYRRNHISYIDTTHSSIEEIASTILSDTGLERRVRA